MATSARSLVRYLNMPTTPRSMPTSLERAAEIAANPDRVKAWRQLLTANSQFTAAKDKLAGAADKRAEAAAELLDTFGEDQAAIARAIGVTPMAVTFTVTKWRARTEGDNA